MLALDLIEIDEIEKDKQLILMASGVHATHLQLHFASLVFFIMIRSQIHMLPLRCTFDPSEQFNEMILVRIIYTKH